MFLFTRKKYPKSFNKSNELKNRGKELNKLTNQELRAKLKSNLGQLSKITKISRNYGTKNPLQNGLFQSLEREAMAKEEANARSYRIKSRPKITLSPLLLPSSLKPKKYTGPKPRTRAVTKKYKGGYKEVQGTKA
jgi:hypothetical protein